MKSSSIRKWEEVEKSAEYICDLIEVELIDTPYDGVKIPPKVREIIRTFQKNFISSAVEQAREEALEVLDQMRFSSDCENCQKNLKELARFIKAKKPTKAKR